MRHILYAVAAILLLASCDDTKTYAEMLDDEKKYITNFIAKSGYTIITSNQPDTMQMMAENTFVMTPADGVYMHIDSLGKGKSIYSILDSLSHKRAGTRMVILARFMEYSLSAQDTIVTNFYTNAAPEQFYYAMNTTQSYYSSAGNSSTYGKFFASEDQTETSTLMRYHHDTSVPAAWLKPLQYVGNGGRVRLIAPSKMGTSSAMSSVLPYYYEIRYTVY